MQNPYESPTADDSTPTVDDSTPAEHCIATGGSRNLHTFYAWYLGAFIVSTLMWHLSGYVRAVDLLELPMAAFHFPLAGFIDPHDGMIRSKSIFFYAILFWGAVIPVAFRVTPTHVGRLRTALGIVVGCAVASTAYTVVYHLLGFRQVP